jgi:hypothetical protein
LGRNVVDESFSHWYVQGGNWINHGLPMFISMERIPEDGCEFQNAACIMTQLWIVKISREVEDNKFDDGNDITLNHGTKVLLKLIQPWQMSDWDTSADSYCASLQAAKELLRVGWTLLKL